MFPVGMSMNPAKNRDHTAVLHFGNQKKDSKPPSSGQSEWTSEDEALLQQGKRLLENGEGDDESGRITLALLKKKIKSKLGRN